MPESLLTKRKQAWAGKFKPKAIRGTPLNPNAAVEARYAAELADLVEKMCADTEKRLLALFDEDHAEEFFAQDASIASQSRITTNALKKKFLELFAEAAKPTAERFAAASNKASSAAVHASIKEMSGGLSISTAALSADAKQILKATITENVGLIKSIADKYLQGVEGAVMRSITTGNGMQTLVPYLAKNKGITLRRARFIAKDQTKKAFENLSTARLQNAGVEEFEWLHTGGSNHPRKKHIEWSGKIFKFSAPPIDVDGVPTMPGEKPGCRCRKIPVIKLRGT